MAGVAHVARAGLGAAPQQSASAAAGAEVLDREAVRTALVNVVSSEDFVDRFMSEYGRLAQGAGPAPAQRPAACAAKPAAAPVAAASVPKVEPEDPKDGNALLQNLLSSLTEPK